MSRKPEISVPKALYEANVAFAMRVAGLLQESGRHWFDLFAREAGARLEDNLSRGMDALKDLDPLQLAHMPVDAAARLLRVDAGRWQALLTETAQQQMSFMQGVEQALGQWQADCARIVEQSGLQVEDASSMFQWPDLPGFAQLAEAMQGFVAPLNPATPEAASEKAATKKAATKKAATKKAATKKAATKKAATKKAATKKAATKSSSQPES